MTSNLIIQRYKRWNCPQISPKSNICFMQRKTLVRIQTPESILFYYLPG